ncbi:unnamed protein product [Adineta steineri]|uniref:Methyltransferase FkbM domain-containing protein n=1 Tax=Adineta steineri TaxID=433720 RepID=A0A815J5C7_9BILA|nr:unnamed protein product [Adineta steineri]CAF3793539.1 unnamed protein product [Adineta steineri]
MNNKFIFILLIVLIVGILIGNLTSNKKITYESNYNSSTISNKKSTSISYNISSHVEIVDFNKPINGNFTCIKTKKLLNYFHSFVCLHQAQTDIYVSKSFQESLSIWEEHGVLRILQLLLRYPHLDFIDIGANIGTYTMYAAALGRFVLAIECFAPNIDRIHRAVELANITNRVVLIQNALYTHSGQYLRLAPSANNVGGQELDIVMKSPNTQNTIYNHSVTIDPYIVKTIKLNDLVPILQARGVRGAIIKMDIEGSESFAVESGSEVFDLFDIPFIQIEWLKVRNFPHRVKFLIDFFTKRDYIPKTFQCQLLPLNNTQTWPDDLCWTKRDVHFC